MTTTLSNDCTYGINDAAPAADLSGLELVEGLAAFVRTHDALSLELAEARGRLNRAAAYSSGATCNPALALANLERLKTRHSGLIARLRANRLAARAFLAAVGVAAAA